MKYWILKTEPDSYSIDDLARDQIEPWNGIRNFQARNFIRDEMSPGDAVLIYHSSCNHVGLAGTAEVTSACYADPAQFDRHSVYYDAKATSTVPKWFVVDIQFKAKAKTITALKTLKTVEGLQELALFKQSRLSVVPVTASEWQILLAMITFEDR